MSAAVCGAVTVTQRTRVITLWAVTVIVAVGLGALGAAWTLSPPDATSPVDPVATFTVGEETVGSSSSVTVQATWRSLAYGVNAGDGTLTSVLGDALATVQPGDVLYSVDLRPVTAAVGSVPSFRDLTLGDHGADVTQLQSFLHDAGFMEAEPDGSFGALTAAAVREWQRHLGVEVTGRVGAGDLVYLPSLPCVVVVEPTFVVGARVSGGDRILTALAPEPDFTLAVASEEFSEAPEEGATVTIHAGEHTWIARTGQLRATADNGSVVTLTAPGEGSICDDACDVIEYSAAGTQLPATLELAPSVSGPAVPVSALAYDAQGGAYVVTEDGARAQVTVVTSDGNRVIVGGLEVGTVVRLFAVDHAEDTANDG